MAEKRWGDRLFQIGSSRGNPYAYVLDRDPEDEWEEEDFLDHVSRFHIITGKPFSEETDPRCAQCGLFPTESASDQNEKVDPCLGILPGVAFACCGHGYDDTGCGSGYVLFTDGMRIQSDNVRYWVELRKDLASYQEKYGPLP